MLVRRTGLSQQPRPLLSRGICCDVAPAGALYNLKSRLADDWRSSTSDRAALLSRGALGLPSAVQLDPKRVLVHQAEGEPFHFEMSPRSFLNI